MILMFQMSGLGPMLGQAHYFRRFAEERVPYAIERYENEAAGKRAGMNHGQIRR